MENKAEQGQELDPIQDQAQAQAKDQAQSAAEEQAITSAEDQAQSVAEDQAQVQDQSQEQVNTDAQPATKQIEELEEFDWENVQSKGFGEDYSDEERSQMEKVYEGTLTEIEEKEVVKGKVVGVSDRDVILNIGLNPTALFQLLNFEICLI